MVAGACREERLRLNIWNMACSFRFEIVLSIFYELCSVVFNMDSILRLKCGHPFDIGHHASYRRQIDKIHGTEDETSKMQYFNLEFNRMQSMLTNSTFCTGAAKFLDFL